MRNADQASHKSSRPALENMEANNDTSYRSRLAQFRILEESRHTLIEELLDKLEKAEIQVRQTALDLKSEQDVRRKYQEEARELRDKVENMEKEMTEAKVKAEVAHDEIARMEGSMAVLQGNFDGLKDESLRLIRTVESANRRPVAVLLIDANVDSLIFQEKYYTKGFKGGERAAEELLSHVHEYLRQIDPNLSGLDVIIKAYADEEALEEMLVHEGKFRSFGQLRQFTTGFGSRLPLSDFIDVGSREDAAMNKLKESARHYAASYQCKHLIIGSSMSRSMISFFESWSTEPSIEVGNITILENSFSPVDGFMLPYRTASFPGIFKNPRKHNRSSRQPLQLESAQNMNQPTVLVIRHESSPSRPGNKNSDSKSVVISFEQDNNRTSAWSERRRIMG